MHLAILGLVLLGMSEALRLTAAGPPSERHSDAVAWRVVVHYLVVGLASGAGYGVALRAWMRLVSTEPEFSWSGTGFIVMAFAGLGTMAGLAAAGRRLRWKGRLIGIRAVGIILSLGCFLGAGLVMLPTIVPAALGRARSDWARMVRVALVVLGATAAGIVVLTMPELGLARRVFALAIYLPLCWVEVVMMAELFAPSLPRGSLGARKGLLLAACTAVPLGVGVVVMMGGFGGT